MPGSRSRPVALLSSDAVSPCNARFAPTEGIAIGTLKPKRPSSSHSRPGERGASFSGNGGGPHRGDRVHIPARRRAGPHPSRLPVLPLGRVHDRPREVAFITSR